MASQIKRAFPRKYHNTPILFNDFGSDDYMRSKMYNFSKGGMYFRSNTILRPDLNIRIVMINYTPGSYGPEAYKGYMAKIRWCRESPDSTDEEKFGIGVQFLEKSHTEFGKEASIASYMCDLCGNITTLECIHRTDELDYLCGDCHKHLKSFPEGRIKESIKRFMAGNVF